MTFSAFVALIFSEIIKPAIAALLSVLMAMGSWVLTPAQRYGMLSLKPLTFNKAELSTDYEMFVNLEKLCSLAGVDLNSFLAELPEGISLPVAEDGTLSLKGGFDALWDVDNLRFNFSVDGNEGENLSLYLDNKAFAVSPDLTKRFIPLFGYEGAAAYDRYFDGYGYYYNFDSALGDEFVPADVVDDISSAFNVSDDANGLLNAGLDNPETLLEIFGDSGLELVQKIIKLEEDFQAKYYTEAQKDGVISVTYALSGMDYMMYLSDAFEILKGEDFAELYKSFLKMTLENYDYNSIASAMGIPAEQTEQYIEIVKNEAQQNVDKVIAEMTAVMIILSDVSEFICDETVGAPENLPEDYLPLIEVLRGYLENSESSSTLYEKDGKIYEDSALSIADGEGVLFEVKSTSSVGRTETVKSADEAVPFGKRLEGELLDNKIGYDNAVKKGVSSIEIEWDSEMAPKDGELVIDSELLNINYKTTVWQMIDEMQDIDDSVKETLKGLYTEEDLETASKDTTARVVDSSVYLPLRMLMENAGYEVSWDAETSQAFVTVNGEKINMTGIIIDNKTYVKVRDFEKLGATVTYEETIYYANDWNDFSKSCYVDIVFAE